MPVGLIKLEQDPNSLGGRIIGEVCHFIDLASAISKSIPIKIYTTSITRADESALTNDNVSINLEFQSGAIANIIYTSEGLESLSKEYIQIFSNGKSAIIDDFKKLTLFKNEKKISNKYFGSKDKGQKNMLDNWITSIVNGKECISPEILFQNSLASILAVESIMLDMPLKINISDLDK